MKALKKAGMVLLSGLALILLLVVLLGTIVPALKVGRLEKLSMQDSAAAAYTRFLPDEDTAFSYAQELVAMGARLPGTPAGEEARQYVVRKMEEFGLEDVSVIEARTSLYTVDHYGLKVDGEDTDCFYICCSGTDGSFADFSTPEGGIEAEMIYVGANPHANVDVRGKIVVAECGFMSMPMAAGRLIGSLYYDPDKTIGLTESKEIVYMGDSFTDSYFHYMEAGAVGYIGILSDYFDSAEYHSEDYTYLGTMSLPGLWVSPAVGKALADRIQHSSEPVMGTIELSGSLREVDAGAVIGWRKGSSEDTIMVHSHYDSITQGAVEDASGMACLLSMAQMFGQIPAEDLEKTVLFVAMDSHFSDYDTHDAVIAELFDAHPILADICVEHIAKDYRIAEDGSIYATGLIDPRIVFVSGSKTLIRIVNEEFVRHGMDRTLVLPANLLGEDLCTDADMFYQEGLPVVSLISSPIYLYDSLDTLDKIDREALLPTCETLSDILWRFMQVSSSELYQ